MYYGISLQMRTEAFRIHSYPEVFWPITEVESGLDQALLHQLPSTHDDKSLLTHVERVHGPVFTTPLVQLIQKFVVLFQRQRVPEKWQCRWTARETGSRPPPSTQEDQTHECYDAT